jgi:uncharacterized delta-60 repeat protein
MAAATATPAVAATGDLDPAFGGDGVSVARFHPDGFGEASELDAEGRLVVAGSGRAHVALARFLPNGELDPSFSGDGKAKFARGVLLDIAILPDGRIVGVGEDRPDRWLVCRITTAGDLDPTFGGDGYAELAVDDGRANGVAFDATGRILVVGDHGTAGAVARYRPSGKLDPTFSGDGVRDVHIPSPDPYFSVDVLNAVAPMTDGGMIVTGEADRGWIATVRLDASGTLVSGFGDNGSVLADFGADDRGESVIVTADRLLIGAFAGEAMVVLAYTFSGDPDPGYGGGDGVVMFDRGAASVMWLQDMTQDLAGRLVVAGFAVNRRLDVVVGRLDGAGVPDPTFGENGVVTVRLHFNESASGVAVRAGGQIVMGGTRTGAKANMMLALQLQG